MRKTLIAGLIGVGLGILVNSIDVKTSKSFKFDNPSPINASESQIRKIVNARPEIRDTKYSLDVLGIETTLATYRTVTNPQTGKAYSGRLDNEGNIHTKSGVYKQKHAHDSTGYERE